MQRNQWFQQRVLGVIGSFGSRFASFGPRPTVFSYSYYALEIFRYAKSRGWSTVLGQIDPGLAEEKIVEKVHDNIGSYKSNWQAAPSEYWNNWREECSLADRIIANSAWSSQALQKCEVNADKIIIAPPPYEVPKNASAFVRTYPSSFSRSRPLRVLFLGQVIVRKGVVPLLEAAKLLRNEPIEFCFVGPVGVSTDGTKEGNVQWVGPVSQSFAGSHYRNADVFVFPSFSDGFGLTQLEALGWKLPIIASRCCGQVVRDGENGLLLDQITPEAIASALLYCLSNPSRLQLFSNCAGRTNPSGLGELRANLELIDHAAQSSK